VGPDSALVTTLGALGGYWLGMQLHQKMLTMVFVLLGIGGGFTLGVKRMLKVTDRYVSSIAKTQAKPTAISTQSSAATDNRARTEELARTKSPNWDEMKDP